MAAPAMTLIDAAERVLASDEVDAKLALTRSALAAWEASAALGFEHGAAPPRPIAFVRFPERPLLVDPRQLPRRKLSSLAGRVALLHAVAHIEFTAVQLAWDLLYRFRGLPAEFYRDWLRVAGEEAEHFGLVRGRLRVLGSDYGHLVAHRGLWDVAADTAHDLAARLALVPRGMEARGLDVTPGIIARLEQVGDADSVAVLKVILHDEIGHVALGSRWFRWVCEQRGMPPDPTYRALLSRYLRGPLRGPYNLEARREAGFSEAELESLDPASRSGDATAGPSPTVHPGTQ